MSVLFQLAECLEIHQCCIYFYYIYSPIEMTYYSVLIIHQLMDIWVMDSFK